MKIIPIGTDVEIVNYGGIAWIHKAEALVLNFKPKVILAEDNDIITYDLWPEKVGLKTKVMGHSLTQGNIQYKLEIGAWYSEHQLKVLKMQSIVIVNKCNGRGSYASYRLIGVFTDREKLNKLLIDLINKREITFDVDPAYIKGYSIESISKSIHFVHIREVALNEIQS